MNELGPGPAAAARNPPSWLVFEDDAPWLVLAAGFELSDIARWYYWALFVTTLPEISLLVRRSVSRSPATAR